MFCTFVLQTILISYSGGNHLSTITHVTVRLSVKFLQDSSPTIVWVSRSWGLPRSTFAVSSKASSLWHFQGYSTISEDLGGFSRRQLSYKPSCPSLFFHWARTLRASQHRASMDFPLHQMMQRLPERYFRSCMSSICVLISQIKCNFWNGFQFNFYSKLNKITCFCTLFLVDESPANSRNILFIHFYEGYFVSL